jgi:hypothetical protein
MEKLKLSLGLLLLPIAYSIFVIDRIIFVLMPNLEHKKFNDWLNNKDIVFAVVRILTLFILKILVYWLFIN